MLSDALTNLSEDNWKEHIRNYELGLRIRGSFYVNITRTDCLKHHQVCNNFLALLTRNLKFIWIVWLRVLILGGKVMVKNMILLIKMINELFLILILKYIQYNKKLI